MVLSCKRSNSQAQNLGACAVWSASCVFTGLVQDFWTYKQLPEVQFFLKTVDSTNVLLNSSRTLWVSSQVVFPATSVTPGSTILMEGPTTYRLCDCATCHRWHGDITWQMDFAFSPGTVT